MELLEQRQAAHRMQLEALQQQDQEREDRLARLRSQVDKTAQASPKSGTQQSAAAGCCWICQAFHLLTWSKISSHSDLT